MTQQPSPYDVLKRWPRAVMALSALSLAGDMKHSDDGREPGRGMPLDHNRYDRDYCYDKLLRHMARTLDPYFDSANEPSTENGVPEEIAILWHAIQAAESVLADYTIEELIEDFAILDEATEPAVTQSVVSVGGYCYGRGETSGNWYGGILTEINGPSAFIVPDWTPNGAPLKVITGVIRDSLTTERPDV